MQDAPKASESVSIRGSNSVIFRDATNGRSTYWSGRFLYVERPEHDGRVTIDFNRAYTPPCGFTPYATCPRAPAQNILPFAVKAGERRSTQHPQVR